MLAYRNRMVVVSSSKTHDFTSPVELARFLVPAMVRLLLVLSPIRSLLVTGRVCVPLLHPEGSCAMQLIVVQRLEEVVFPREEHTDRFSYLRWLALKIHK